MRLIEVEYEPLPPLVTIDAALDPASPRIQEYGDGHKGAGVGPTPAYS